MRARIICLSLLFIVVAALCPLTPAIAADVLVSTAPPEPLYEVDLDERPGFVISPGYWRWDGKRHLWQPSRWIAQREGYNWVPDQWQQRGDKWYFAAGHWEVDTAYEEVEDKTEAEQPVVEPVKKKSVKKRVKKIDYSDTNKWPRARRR